MPANSLVNIPVKFKLNLNYNLDTHTIYFLAIYKQHFLPTESDPYIPTYTAPYMLDVDVCENSQKQQSTTNNSDNFLINSSYIKNDDLNYWTGIDNSSSIEAFTSKNSFNLKSNKVNNVFTFGAVLPDNIYSTIIFLDNNPIMLSDSNYSIIWKSEANKLMYYNFNIDTSLNEDVHQMYSITLPLKSNDNFDFYESGKIKISTLE